MSRVRWPGQLWYSTCMICTAVSVLPVPGGPTTMVNPGCTPDLIASTCKCDEKVGVKAGNLHGVCGRSAQGMLAVMQHWWCDSSNL